MKTKKITTTQQKTRGLVLSSLTLLGALIFAPSANAVVVPFIIDDFDVNTSSSVTATTGTTMITGSSVIDGANIVMNGAPGWTRNLKAELTAGAEMTTAVCHLCTTGQVTMGNFNSNGIGTLIYSGSAIDLSSYAALQFDWAADQAGASVDIIFSDGSNTSTAASWSSLANTSGSLVTQAAMGITWGSVNSSAVTSMEFIVTGVANMNSSIDNIEAVPVPPAVWLFGSGLMGLIGIARRKKA